MFMDPLAMQVMTLPFVYPIVTALGFDGVWFGVIMVKLVEIAVLTAAGRDEPLRGRRRLRRKVKLREIYRGIRPSSSSRRSCWRC